MTDEVDASAAATATATATASMDPPLPTDDVDLSELLSTCIDACRRGCEVIRNVRHRSLLRTYDDDDAHDAPSAAVTYKIADDPRSALTEADGASQKVIIECLSSCWSNEIESGKIKIVGEEEDDHSTDLEGDKSFDTAYSDDMTSHFDNYNCPRTDIEPIDRDMFRRPLPSPFPIAASDAPPTTRSRAGREERGRGGDDASGDGGRCGGINDEIIVFIDPMDGTREFVEGRIQNVQCLIGITLNGRPVAGAMGMPMVHDTRIEVAYGLITLEGDARGEGDDGDDDGGGNSSDSVIPIPVLSGIKFFDALNPLVRDVPHNVGASGKNDEIGDDGDYDHDHDDDGTLVVFSGDSMKPSLNLAMDVLENRVLGGSREEWIDTATGEGIDEVYLHPPVGKVIVGGCGHKILSVQRHVQSLVRRRMGEEEEREGSSTSSSRPMVGAISLAPPGSSSWDTAAPTAVLLAADPRARVTDLLGRPLIYDGDNLSNKCGVVASSGSVACVIHDRLCMGLRKDDALNDLLCVNLSDKAIPDASGLDDKDPLVEFEFVRSISELDLVRSISELNS